MVEVRRRRVTLIGVVAVIVLLIAFGAFVDIALITLSSIAAIGGSSSELVDAGAVLASFTFYPAIAVETITLLAGAALAWQRPDVRSLGFFIAGLGVISAVLILLTFIPKLLGQGA